jgi:putative FmdB family regulatory protein
MHLRIIEGSFAFAKVGGETMPIYEYRCTQCHHTFELFQHVGEQVPSCPKCGSPSKKVYASVGLIFKGSGFHTTDYRKSPASDNGEKPASGTETPAATPATPTATPAPGTGTSGKS